MSRRILREMMRRSRLLLSIGLFVVLSSIPAPPLAAEAASEGPTGVAEYIRLAPGETAVTGDIIVSTSSGFRRSREPYSSQLVGVITEQPAVAVSYVGRAGAHPLSTAGSALVRVSNESGPIVAGDPITSSAIPGVGMKATASGPIIGYAQAALTDSRGLIPVLVSIHAVSATGQSAPGAVPAIGQIQSQPASAQPAVDWRLVAAAIIFLMSLILSLLILRGRMFHGRETYEHILLTNIQPKPASAAHFLMATSCLAAGTTLSVYILTL